jgi:hypothetical protein
VKTPKKVTCRSCGKQEETQAGAPPAGWRYLDRLQEGRLAECGGCSPADDHAVPNGAML